MTHAGDDADRTWCISEVGIFRDLSEQEMAAIAAAAPMKTSDEDSQRLELRYSSAQPSEVLFILKKGRVRISYVGDRPRADRRTHEPAAAPARRRAPRHGRRCSRRGAAGRTGAVPRASG